MKLLFKLALVPLLGAGRCSARRSSRPWRRRSSPWPSSRSPASRKTWPMSPTSRGPPGMADYGKTARFFVGAMTAGIDKERPDRHVRRARRPASFTPSAFVPLEPNGLDTILKVHKEQARRAQGCGRRNPGVRHQPHGLRQGAGRLGVCCRKQGVADGSAARSRRAARRPAQVVQRRRQAVGAEHSRAIAEDGRSTKSSWASSGSSIRPPPARETSTASRRSSSPRSMSRNIEKLINEADELYYRPGHR